MATSPKVSMTPSQQVVAAAAAVVEIKDVKGRQITLKKPGVLAQFRLVEVLGGATASNQAYMGMVFPLIYVSAIDGDVVHLPKSKLEVEALIQRLDEEGVQAVHTAVQESFGGAPGADEKATLKN